MRTFYMLLSSAFLLCFTFTSQAQGKWSDWAELKSFHEVMSQTFHPAEEGNLQPIKTRSAEMLKKAKALKKSKVPAAFNKPEILKAIQDLESGAKELDKLVKNKASDADITAKLSALHDVFHRIVGLCRDNGEKHEAH